MFGGILGQVAFDEAIPEVLVGGEQPQSGLVLGFFTDSVLSFLLNGRWIWLVFSIVARQGARWLCVS
jgi:hypothetical protein